MAADSFAFASTGQHPDEEKLPSGQAVVTTALATEPLETELPQATGKSDSATIASPVPAPAQDAAAGADTRMSPGPQPTIPSSPDAAASLPVVPARKAEAQPATDVTPARTEPLPTTDSDAQRTAVVRPEASAVTKAETMPAASHPAARQNAAPAHRRSTAEVAAPRRGADTRRRIDIPAGETASAALPQHATETAQSGELVSATVQAKGDTIVQQTLTVARDGAWLDKLAHDIASSAGNGGDLQFKLDPERLGSLTVAINQSADGASIRLTADNETTRNLLIEAQPRLLAEAHAQGLRVSDTHVDLNQHQTANQNQGQQQQQSQQQQPQSHQNQSQDMARWAQGNGGQNGTANGQNRQSSPGHQPFVSNLARKGEAETESSGGDSDALYA
jgi:flagellar hook-length control protein FliK